MKSVKFIEDDLCMLDVWECKSCGEPVYAYCEVKPLFCTSCGVEFSEWTDYKPKGAR